MLLKCRKCKKIWDYKGKKKVNKKYAQWVCCPTCRNNVKLEEYKKDEKNDWSKEPTRKKGENR